MHFQYTLLVSFPCTHWWASCISPLLSIYARISVGKFSLLVEVALNLEVKNPKRNCLNKGSSQRFLPNSIQIPIVTTFFSHKMGQKQSCWWGDEVIVKWCLHLALRWLKRRNLRRRRLINFGSCCGRKNINLDKFCGDVAKE